MWEDVFGSKNVKTGSYLETRVPPIKSTKILSKLLLSAIVLQLLVLTIINKNKSIVTIFFWRSLAREIIYLLWVKLRAVLYGCILLFKYFTTEIFTCFSKFLYNMEHMNKIYTVNIYVFMYKHILYGRIFVVQMKILLLNPAKYYAQFLFWCIEIFYFIKHFPVCMVAYKKLFGCKPYKQRKLHAITPQCTQTEHVQWGNLWVCSLVSKVQKCLSITMQMLYNTLFACFKKQT